MRSAEKKAETGEGREALQACVYDLHRRRLKKSFANILLFVRLPAQNPVWLEESSRASDFPSSQS